MQLCTVINIPQFIPFTLYKLYNILGEVNWNEILTNGLALQVIVKNGNLYKKKLRVVVKPRMVWRNEDIKLPASRTCTIIIL